MTGHLINLVNPQVCASAQQLAAQFAAARPFKHIVIDDFLDSDYCQKLIQEFPEFDEQLAINEDGVVGAKAVREQIRDISPAYEQLDRLSSSEDFRELIGTITGIEALNHDPHYFGGGTHENREGQGLDAHVDFNYHPITREHRRLNLIVYLNPEWRDEWGGALQLHRDPYLPPSQDDIKVVTPLANRCVIFETNEYSWHGFKRIQLPDNRKGLSRKSFALYYYTEDRPEDETAPEHSTIYVEEHLPEWYEAGMTLDTEELQRIRVLVASRDQHLKRLYGYISHLNSELAQLRLSLQQASEATALPLTEAELTTSSDTDVQAKLHDLSRSLQVARARVQELEQSTSWRITAPIRALKRLFSGHG
ncbi:MAG: 2OG-Fe(II) oxygenase [Xanthomonadales bacterium]|nr:2OG-Fe(II) oxygenase [Xanthomonadales bacterium]